MKFLELTVRQRASKEARDGLQEYKKLTEKVRPRSRCLPTHDGAAVACDERWNGGVTPLGDRAWHGTRGVRTWVGGSHRGRSPHWGDALPRSPPPGCALTSSWRSLGVAVGTRVLCDRRSAAGGDDDQQGEGGRRRAACCRGIGQRGRHRKCWRSGGSAPPPPPSARCACVLVISISDWSKHDGVWPWMCVGSCKWWRLCVRVLGAQSCALLDGCASLVSLGLCSCRFVLPCCPSPLPSMSRRSSRSGRSSCRGSSLPGISCGAWFPRLVCVLAFGGTAGLVPLLKVIPVTVLCAPAPRQKRAGDAATHVEAKCPQGVKVVRQRRRQDVHRRRNTNDRVLAEVPAPPWYVYGTHAASRRWAIARATR